jgi:putative mRNA 3-end processing factor
MESNLNGAARSARFCRPGHILGAAQLLIEHGGERLVYSGDIKLRAPLCGVAAGIAPCDRLIIECTFGLPIYHFLERDDAAARIVAFARECLDEGVTPIFYGYALGRGQEIVHVLCRAGIPVAVHGAVARFIPLYEQAGYGFDGWQPYDAKQTRGKALVLTPSMGRIVEARGKNFRVAYVSGWAALANARAKAWRRGTHTVFRSRRLQRVGRDDRTERRAACGPRARIHRGIRAHTSAARDRCSRGRCVNGRRR